MNAKDVPSQFRRCSTDKSKRQARRPPSLSSQAAGYCVSSSKTDEAISTFLTGLDTPRALTVLLLYSSGEHNQLVSLKCDPANYLDENSELFARDYAATKLLSKAKFLRTGIDTAAVAMQSFWDCETANRETNKRFRNMPALLKERADAAHIVNSVARKVSMILHCDFNVEEWLDACAWGPGATYHMRGDDTGPECKFLQEGGITPTLRRFIEPIWDSLYPGWKPEFQNTWGSRVLTVSKNAKTDRVIAAEPGINSWFQAGLDTMLRRCLLRQGIDLSTQERNQLLAFYGAVTGANWTPSGGQLATIDFKAASDSVCTEVIRALFPLDWYHAMDLCRCRCSEVDGTWLPLEKFSSMGNGFTFPLQTIVFLAIALAVCEDADVSSEYVGVYGDDVVLPQDVASTYIDWCAFFGFTTNKDKSFTSGSFRESCGSHYHRFRDVKPLYIEDKLRDISSVFKLANGIKHFAGQGCTYGRDPAYYPAWSLLYNSVPKHLRFHIPEGYGDGGFVSDFDEAVPFVKRAGHTDKYRWCEGFLFSSLVLEPKGYECEHSGVLLSRLLDIRGPNQVVFPWDTYYWEPETDRLVPIPIVSRKGTSRPGKANLAFYRRATRLRINTRSFAAKWPSRGGWMF